MDSLSSKLDDQGPSLVITTSHGLCTGSSSVDANGIRSCIINNLAALMLKLISAGPCTGLY